MANPDSLAIVNQPAAEELLSYESNITRKSFPEGFIFGSGTAAYQVEGAARTANKGISIWDNFTWSTPGKIADGSNGNVAANMYHRYKEDIKAMKRIGFDGYRFSISWTRILPGGRCSAGINREGIDYYNELIDTIIDHGMKPYVTIFHWDLPLTLQNEYGGFLSRNIVKDFLEYAELCFSEFGDRVKWWTTINEPWSYAVFGYVLGTFPPGIFTGSPDQILTNIPGHRGIPNLILPTTRSYSDRSDSAKDVYAVGRNMLLAHAAAVHLYRKKFKPYQHGLIGLVLNVNWSEPFDEKSEADRDAAARAMDFALGWFLEPVLFGRYPQTMMVFVSPPENLAPFSPSESQMLKGSIDYLGLNYYTAAYAANDPNPVGEGYYADQHVAFGYERDGKLIGPLAPGSTWLHIVPWGLYKLLVYIKDIYLDIYKKDKHVDVPIYITENGVCIESDYKLTAIEACPDPIRIRFHHDHLVKVLEAIRDKSVNVKSYFIWAWCDTFEWSTGYTTRFGITYVDFINDQTRYPKDSSRWFAMFLHDKVDHVPPLPSSKRRRHIENNNEEESAKRKRAPPE